MKQDRCISSLVYSHIQRNVNCKHNDEQTWKMRRSNFEAIKQIGSKIGRELELDESIESIRANLEHKQFIDSKKVNWALLVASVASATETRRIMEIGTSVGISAAYISKYSPNSIIDTIELDEQLVKQAKDNIVQLQMDNVDVYQGDYRKVMPQLLAQYEKQYGVIFKDGYHVGSANISLIKFLDIIGWTGIVILDDIRWSWDMLSAWNEIKLMPNVRGIIDCYHIGILYLDNKSQYPKEFYKYSLKGLIPK